MLEVVALYDLWIWHAYFGAADANNDIKFLDNSPLFEDLIDDIALVALFQVSGTAYEKGYYLADDLPTVGSFCQIIYSGTWQEIRIIKRR